MKISICDYNVGNLSSVVNLCRHFGYEPIITSDWKVMDASDVLILPGQGAYATAMQSLESTGAVDFISDYVQSARPFLGICVGFQLLFEGSEENGFTKGLSLFPGVFKRFESDTLKVPHMGWNTLSIGSHSQMSTFDQEYVYFVHSYYLDNTDPDLVLSTTSYSQEFVSSISRPNLLATQFHPEKSGDIGLSLLRSYLDSIS